MDAVANRDFVLDYLSAAATCATHLSRLGAEIVLWSSEEFGFAEVCRRLRVRLKPDAAEEEPRRRRTAARQGAARARVLTTLHGVMHGLPLTYNKDMQEDKEALFDAVDTLELCLDAAIGMLERNRLQARPDGRRIEPTRCSPQSTSPTCSSARAFRSARPTASSDHSSSTAVDNDKKLGDLTDDELAQFSDKLGDDYRALLSGNGWIESKVSQGGTSTKSLDAQFELASAALDSCG